MAALFKTITESIRVFGPAPSDKWNAYAWNAFKWGEGTKDIATRTLKLVAEAISPSDALAKAPRRSLSESISPVDAMGSERLYDRDGYYHVFPNDTTEATDRDFASWTAGAAGATTWTSSGVTSTTWSAT